MQYSFKEIRAGINAFTLMEKDIKATNLPLKEPILDKALRLINKTMSEDLIRSWIKKCRPFLECEKQERKDFDNQVKKVEKELKAKTHVDFEGEIGSADRIFPHEFLFLLCNTKSRLEQIKRLPLPEFTIER